MSAATLPVRAAGPASQLLLEPALRKSTWRIIPLLGPGYLVNFLDRTSVGFAALQMNQDLGLTATQFGWEAGTLFFSYCVLEVPSNLAMYPFGARRWLPRIMVTWGLAAAATALAVGPWSCYVLRFALGMVEAGFFPGVIWYISIWYPGKYRTNAMALFIAAAPLSQPVGGPISVSLLQRGRLPGLAGWQCMFILEGLPAILTGVACLRFLADTPAQATWLTCSPRHNPQARRWFLLTNQRIAAAARDWGLVNEVVPGDAPMARCGSLAAEIARADPVAPAETKAALNHVPGEGIGWRAALEHGQGANATIQARIAARGPLA